MQQELNKLEGESVKKLFLSLSMPAIIAQIVNLLYNIVDRIYIGHIPEIGPLALTGVGITMPIIIVISAFSALIAMGGAPKVAIKLGEKKEDEAQKIMDTCFSALVFSSIILTLIILLFKEKLILAFGGSANTLPYAIDYITIYSMGTIFVQIALGMNLFITTQGFAKVGMITTVIGAALNIVLDPIFIFLLKMDVKGAALATIISQGVSAIWVIRFLSSRERSLRLNFKRIKIDKNILLGCMALGMSPFIMQSTESILQIAFNRSLLKYGGDLYVGAMTIISTVSQLLTLPLMGFTQGGQPIISYNYGAKKYDRVMETVKLMFISCFGYALIFITILMLKPEIFIRIFTDKSELISATASVIRVYMAGMILFSLQMSAQQSFLAMGRARISIFLALLRKIILLIPLIYILPIFIENKIFAVFLAEPIADITSAIVAVTAFTIFIKKLTKNKVMT